MHDHSPRPTGRVICLMITALLAAGCQQETLPNAESPTDQSPVGAKLVSNPTKPTYAKFNDEGELLLPENYREWMFVGCTVTPNDMNDGKALFPEFHHVYVDPTTWQAIKKTGEFPEGAVMLKEENAVGAKEAESGKGYFEGRFGGIGVLYKDTEKYADTGGWGFFGFSRDDDGVLSKKSKAIGGDTCYGCHTAAATEMVFTQHYAILRTTISEATGEPIPKSKYVSSGMSHAAQTAHAAAMSQKAASADPGEFEKKVLPIFQAKCASCHSTIVDGKSVKPKAGIALDSADGILTAKGGKVVVPGDPESSKLVDAISREKRPMPPKGDRLTANQIATITKWVKDGAKFDGWKGNEAAPAMEAPKSEADTTSNSNGGPDLVAMFPQWTDATKLSGDLDAGTKYFHTKTINTPLTCVSCHSFDPRDSMQVDGDGLKRAGFPVYAAAHRTNIKGSGTDLVTPGGNLCVLHFMKDTGTGMSAQEMANMDAYLQSGGGNAHAAAANVDYADVKWTIPETLTGGNALNGAKLGVQFCNSCHTVDGKKWVEVEGSGEVTGGSYSADDLTDLVQRIRNPDFKVNDQMPGFSDLRMTNAELLDILAWLTKP